MDYVLLFIASICAGVLNSVAGGGSFFTFPMLLFTGMNPIVANATSTMATWPGTVASAFAYRSEINANRSRLPMLMTTSLIGSILGAYILLSTPANTFSKLVPYLLLVATLLFAFSGTLTKMLRERAAQGKRSFHLNTFGSICLQLIIAIYGGYFGGGMGIMMLAMLGLLGLTKIHEMNALKTVLGTIINGVAVVIFIVAQVIAWPQAIVMIVGSILGGYGGANYAKKMPPEKVRQFVIIIGGLLTLYFFIKS